MISYQSCENILMRLAYFGSTSSKRAGCADVAELADAQDLGSCALVVCRFDSCHPQKPLKTVGLAHFFLCQNFLKNESIFQNSMKNSMMLCQKNAL